MALKSIVHSFVSVKTRKTFTNGVPAQSRFISQFPCVSQIRASIQHLELEH